MTTTTTYTMYGSDSPANHGNDFDSEFSWAVYGHDETDWIQNRNTVGVVIENRDVMRFFIVQDSLADIGFIDYTIGWYCDEVSRQPISEEEWDRFGPRQELLSMVPRDYENGYTSDIVDRINLEAAQGFTENPTLHLSEILDAEDCYWLGYAAYVREPESGHVFRCMPQFYARDEWHSVIDLPKDGFGWLSDCSIDADAWITAILDSGDNREVTNEMEELLEDCTMDPYDWDYCKNVAQAFSTVIATVESE